MCFILVADEGGYSGEGRKGEGRMKEERGSIFSSRKMGHSSKHYENIALL